MLSAAWLHPLKKLIDPENPFSTGLSQERCSGVPKVLAVDGNLGAVTHSLDTSSLVVVDAANVVGSKPDGWWRDRAGATERLRDRLVAVAAHGLAGWPTGQEPEVVLVVEGLARSVAGIPGVRVVAADGSADDAIVELIAAERGDRPCLVVTADRELRRRVSALGADTLGPKVLR